MWKAERKEIKRREKKVKCDDKKEEEEDDKRDNLMEPTLKDKTEEIKEEEKGRGT